MDMNELTIKGGQFGLEAAVERLAHGFLVRGFVLGTVAVVGTLGIEQVAVLSLLFFGGRPLRGTAGSGKLGSGGRRG